jgi:hypothetical protein
LPSEPQPREQHKTSIGKLGVGKDGQASTIPRSIVHPAIYEFLGKRILSHERFSFVSLYAAFEDGP